MIVSLAFALRPMARFARCDVRLGAAVFVESDETTMLQNQPRLESFRRLLLQIGGANIARVIAPPSSRDPDLGPASGRRLGRRVLKALQVPGSVICSCQHF